MGNKKVKSKKIAVVGTANQGKTTLVQDMVKQWPIFKTPEKTYLDIVKEKGLTLNKETNKETQKELLNFEIDTMMHNYGKNSKVVFDRCSLDVLVYSMWSAAKQKNDIDDNFITWITPQVRESLKFLDIILFIPLTKHHQVEIEDNGIRETDENYIKEVDALFKALIQSWRDQTGKFFPKDDCPPVIEIFGDRETRINMLKMYIDEKGEFYGEDQSLLNDMIVNN